MSTWITLDDKGLVMTYKIAAVGNPNAAGMQRLIAATTLTKLIDLTNGKKRQSVLVLDSGHIVLSSLSVTEVEDRLDRANRTF